MIPTMGHFTPPKLLFALCLLFPIAASFSTSNDRKTYIIHMDKTGMPSTFSTQHDWYVSTLSSLSSPDDIPPIHLYSYKHVMDGFSAVLSQTHLDQLESLPAWPAGKFGDDVIIGVLDTGIWPESESFNDKNMPPVPQRWRGICETGTEFNTSYCNKKLIGARKFSQGMKQVGLNISSTDDYDFPRDYMGHGSHTSSTAGGSPVQHADYFGYAKGTATGMAPLARIAMYKVIFYSDGYDVAATDTLAGMDQAIEDGVDIMSLSLGFFETPFHENPIAIGAFAALKKGIFVTCSAGNSGPRGYTMLNGAPWLTTIGAGTIDRQFGAEVTLGNGSIIVTGTSIYPENLFISRVPVYFGLGNRSKEVCDWNSLDPKDVAGKFLFCDYDDESSQFRQMSENDRYGPDIAGATGAIFSEDDAEFLHPDYFYMPIVIVSTKDGNLLKNYIMNTTNATVSVKFGLTLLGTKPAPKVAYFSSRGPDRRSPWTLKPDILDPGYHILAAWVPKRGFAPIHNSSVYRAVISAPQGMKALVQPTALTFSGKNSKAEFNMTVEIDLEAASVTPQSDYFGNYGFLSWYEVNGRHVVRSPVVSAIAFPET
ncbi:hypothetical protein POTOM_033217 [Populus tomentosa]|uniref:Subtilase family protein n=1 Tax=Populus tomentosa TaxID=118781 RepID=A0A8X7Z1M5_POPTO|nr:hypothetical protein POTOM_033217 [Populus tomentosa]